MSLNTVCKDPVKQKNLIVRKSTQSHTSTRWKVIWKSGIWNLKFCSRNQESFLSFEQNPASKFHWQKIRNPVPGIFSMEFRIQDCLGLLYMKQFTKIPKFDDNLAKFILNEIQPFKSLKVVPHELLCENMISWNMKITCYFHMWKDHRCYGYIINRAFCSKKY